MTKGNNLLEEILLAEPSPNIVRLILANFMDKANYKQVIKYGTEVLRRNPYDVELMKILAQAYEMTGFMGQAEDMLQRACSYVDSFSVLYKRLGQLYARRGRNDEAIACFKKYLAHFPDDDEVAQLLHDLAQSEEPPEKTPSLKELATPTLAEIYFNQGQIKEAIEIYENVLSRHPDDFEAAKRLEELKAMVEPSTHEEHIPDQLHHEKPVSTREQWLIGVLENWLGKVLEINRAL